MGYNESWSLLGGIKMIIIPSHIERAVNELYAVLKQKCLKRPNDTLSKDCFEAIKSIKKSLKREETAIISKNDYYVIMLRAIQEMIDIADIIPFGDRQSIFLQIEVDDELIDALNFAEVRHPQIKKELEKVAELFKNPSQSIEKVDAYCDKKIFKLVKSEEEWHEIVSDEGYDLTKNSFGEPYFTEIKIFFFVDYNGYDKAEGYAKEAKQHLISLLGEEDVERKKTAFEKLFKLGVIGTYYIYIPE